MDWLIDCAMLCCHCFSVSMVTLELGLCVMSQIDWSCFVETARYSESINMAQPDGCTDFCSKCQINGTDSLWVKSCMLQWFRDLSWLKKHCRVLRAYYVNLSDDGSVASLLYNCDAEHQQVNMTVGVLSYNMCQWIFCCNCNAVVSTLCFNTMNYTLG